MYATCNVHLIHTNVPGKSCLLNLFHGVFFHCRLMAVSYYVNNNNACTAVILTRGKTTDAIRANKTPLAP